MAKENHDPITMLSSASTTPKSSSRLLHQKSLEKSHQKQQKSPQNLNNASDLFELLERCQSQRLDDQRCVLPSYFLQVSSYNLVYSSLTKNTKQLIQQI